MNDILEQTKKYIDPLLFFLSTTNSNTQNTKEERSQPMYIYSLII
jgi:hypothetical protein